MKNPILLLPGLVPVCFAMILGAQTPTLPSTGDLAQRDVEIRELHQELDSISARLAALESGGHNVVPRGLPAEASAIPAPAAPAASSSAVTDTAVAPAMVPALAAEDGPTLQFFRGTTINVGLDGDYGYNFNQPLGRVNLLRAYDVSSNSFSINQASLVIERLPQATPGQRFGGRVDLQFGQATETLQGSSANEQRPQVWRNLFQAYGSYLAPIGSGLQIDFGKFASSLGVEGNYTKDQIAYSRAYLFNYLPFYHAGVRANYNVTPKLNVGYWLVNGAQQTEDFNGFKSQAFLLTAKPSQKLTWTVNYYFGEEQRDVLPTLNPGAATEPTQPGLPTTAISPVPNGREHIFDTYATWSATPKLTIVGEADYVVNRTYAEATPGRVAAGAVYARYALPRSWNIAGRAEYFDDRGGLFSGTTQALKEVTLVADHQVAPGFLARAEYRTDFSNRRFFLTDVAGALNHSQTTATMGLVYWWGTKQGSW